jgi:hypothetical protein
MEDHLLDKKELAAIGRFFVEVLIATLIFFAVAVPAILLDWFVQLLQNYHVSKRIVQGLEGLEMAIFGLDLVLCIIFLLRSAVNLVKELWKH